MQPPKIHFRLGNLDELVKRPLQSACRMQSGGSCHGQPLLQAVTPLFAPAAAFGRVQHLRTAEVRAGGEDTAGRAHPCSSSMLGVTQPCQPWGSFSQGCAWLRPFRDVSQLQLRARGMRQPQDGFGGRGMPWKDKAPVLQPGWPSPVSKLGSVAGTALSCHSQPCSSLVAPVPSLWGSPLYPNGPRSHLGSKLFSLLALPELPAPCSVLQGLSNPCHSPFFPHTTPPSTFFPYSSLLRPSQPPSSCCPRAPQSCPWAQGPWLQQCPCW